MPLPDEIPAMPRIGVSACLLGAPVRFDSGHKRDGFLVDVLARYVEFVPICPEVAVGLPVPRQAIRLVQAGEGIFARGSRDANMDLSSSLRDFGSAVAESHGDLSGYVLKKGSPSCGMERVRIYRPDGVPVAGKGGRGLFAEALMRALPLLPVEEEGRLHDAALRENFLTRVYAYQRWQDFLAQGLSPAGLVAFHARHKLLLLAHEPVAYRELGRLVANAGSFAPDELASLYGTRFMAALKQVVTRGRHVNVLQHCLGYLRQALPDSDRQEMATMLLEYGQGLLPLPVPLRFFRHFFRRHPQPYLQQQWYFRPHPEALGLRNPL